MPTPVVAHELIFLTSGHGNANPVIAVKTNAKGKIKLAKGESANDNIAYRLDRRGTYMQTPLVYGDYLYCCRDNGVLSCFEAKTGKEVYQKRLGSGMTGFTASPVAADGKIYCVSEDGDVFVVKAGPTYELLAKNAIGEVVMATPAVSDGLLIFRGLHNVYAIKAP